MRAPVLLAAAAAGLLVAGGVAVVAHDRGVPGETGTGRAVAAQAHAAPATAPAAAPPAAAPPGGPPGWALASAVASGPPDGWVATLSAPVTWSSAPGGPPSGTLAATDPFGAAQVLGLVGRPRPDGWGLAELPVRPNGTTGWVQVSLPQVTLATTPYRVSVSVSARTLTVTDAGAVVLQTPVAVGSPRTPTPTVTTYVWELVRPDQPDGGYGPYILGLAEFSDTYATFNGGNAQIGIHGTDLPASIGTATSHGCIRVPDDVVTRLAGLLPLGTPVVVAA
ncbi:MAG TPA: L,D-transpeptidase [Acidimicrobiales bacterium]|nr:L,D-transpeptidase [Acidimicrobiales bacterium]